MFKRTPKRTRSFYLSSEWFDLRVEAKRQNAIANNGCRCSNCGRREHIDGVTRFEVHHILKVREYPELALDPNNVTVLCEICHAELHRHNRLTRLPIWKSEEFYRRQGCLALTFSEDSANEPAFSDLLSEHQKVILNE